MQLFLDIYRSFMYEEYDLLNVARSIYDHAHQRDKIEFLGINRSPDAEQFWELYPMQS